MRVFRLARCSVLSLICFALCLASQSSDAVEYVAFGDAGHSVSEAGHWADAFNGFMEQYQSSPNNFASSTWEFTGLANGTYYISANWTTDTNRSTVAKYDVSDGLGGVVIDQQDYSRDFFESVPGVGVVGWKDLGTATVTDGDLSVTLTDNGDFLMSNLYIMADAIRIDTSPGATELAGVGMGTVIDNGGHGFAIAGEGLNAGALGGAANWGAAGEGYNSDVLYDWEDSGASHSGALTATWTFDGLEPGAKYEVSTTWTPHPNRGTSIPFTVSGVVGGDEMVSMDQQPSPNSSIFEFDDNEIPHQFQKLGNFVTTGTELVVTLSNAANGFVIADAVRIQRVPEPGTLALASCSLLALAFRRRQWRVLRSKE